MQTCNLALALTVYCALVGAAAVQAHYFAHDTVEDRYGVIAPWYKGQNGQFDYRVRVAAETIKRYPWTAPGRAIMPAPEYVYNGTWSIDHDGKITPVEEKDWNNGDLPQRAAFLIDGMIDYYRYSGDPAAFTHISAEADYLVGHCQTPANHGWPEFLISVPTMGVRYGDCRVGQSDDLKASQGKIQLDIVGEVGYELVRAYEVTGNRRWYDAAKHWGDLLAQNRRTQPGISPWGRYADNARGAGMNGIQTGGAALILLLFDELIRTGYVGNDGNIVKARDQGRKYLKDVLLPAWTTNDTWGRHFWDWENPTQARYLTSLVAEYLMNHPDYFTNWKNDVRNILTIFINHTSVNPASNSNTYSGAWAMPESAGCCGRSLWYATMSIASSFAQYGVAADSEWAREIARRSELLATYDGLPNGQSEDLIDGGAAVNKKWFKIAQPMALTNVLRAIAFLPEVMAPNRENHIVRTSSTVQNVVYRKGQIQYRTFDAPPNSVDVLRLSYLPASIRAGDALLSRRSDLRSNGYTVKTLSDGDQIVTIRHDGATRVAIGGSDPQTIADDHQLTYDGSWRSVPGDEAYGGSLRVATRRDASATYQFTGNQVRLLGTAGPAGGRADVFVDGVQQLAGIDYYSPVSRAQQVLYYLNGLVQGSHTLKIVARGTHNPLSRGDEVNIDAAESSGATGDSGFGEGGGPTGAQRLIFGYTSRRDYIDSQKNSWRPGGEFIVRTGNLTDSVAKTWWTMPQAVFVTGTPDPVLYQYGIHWPDITVNLTAGPGTYHVRLKFAETQYTAPDQRTMDISINGKSVAEGFDICRTAGGPNKATDLAYENVAPSHGIISVHLAGRNGREAALQAMEIVP